MQSCKRKIEEQSCAMCYIVWNMMIILVIVIFPWSVFPFTLQADKELFPIVELLMYVTRRYIHRKNISFHKNVKFYGVPFIILWLSERQNYSLARTGTLALHHYKSETLNSYAAKLLSLDGFPSFYGIFAQRKDYCKWEKGTIVKLIKLILRISAVCEEIIFEM